MKSRKPAYSFESDDGLLVEVYHVEVGDAAYLVDLFDHLSTDSRYMRFNQFLESVDSQIVQREAEHIATVDPARGRSLLAFADLPDQPNAPVAGARYVRTDIPQQAEVSLSVRDDMQHQGIGGHMLLCLFSEALKDGLRTLVGTFQTNNRRIWALLGESPYQSNTVIDGFQTTVTIDLQTLRSRPEEVSMTHLDGQQVR